MSYRSLCLGSFDILHEGHFELLDYAKRLGGVSIGLGTDEYQARYKHHPVRPYADRARALAKLGYAVYPRDQVHIGSLVDHIKPDYLVAGSDWIDGPFLELSGIDVGYLVEHRITLVYTPRTQNTSTSEILKRIREAK